MIIVSYRTLVTLCKQFSARNNNKKTTRKETILDYFENSDQYNLNIPKGEEIDIKMLNIIRKIHLDSRAKES